jgi:putative IMPACT (imprinted ancient) family translation regulator
VVRRDPARGGLIRAYGEAVALALDAARVVTMEQHVAVAVDVGHADGPRVEHALRGRDDVAVSRVEYLAAGVRIHAAAAPDGVDTLAGVVAALTSGAGRVVPGAPLWVVAGA